MWIPLMLCRRWSLWKSTLYFLLLIIFGIVGTVGVFFAIRVRTRPSYQSPPPLAIVLLTIASHPSFQESSSHDIQPAITAIGIIPVVLALIGFLPQYYEILCTSYPSLPSRPRTLTAFLP